MRVLLVRHGRSAHVHRGWIDRAQFGRWRELYEAAGIDERDEPPATLRRIAAESGLIVASTASRAIQSAQLLAPNREIVASPLLAELELLPPNIRGVRMPLIGWAVAIGLRWLWRKTFRRAHVSAAEWQRVREAADWLTDLAEDHETVLAVTHASFRSVLAPELIARGWTCEVPKKRTSHWSVFALQR